MAKNIGDLVRKIEQDYLNGTTTISKYVQFNMGENIDKIDAYLNSKHTSGEKDSMGREKPFFNIVTAAVNIWFRATDIDRKNIRVRATMNGQTVLAFIASILLQEWMKKSSFGVFLNDWGRSLARYGSSVVKFVEKEGELYSDVVPWNRFICDTVDFDANPKVEKLWLTPAQLLKRKGYDQKMVKTLLDTVSSRQTLDGQQKDNKADYIPVYEIHGELPLSYLTGKDEDDDKYVQQMHVVSFVSKKEKGEFDDYTLVSGKEAKDPYMITHLIREDGRTQSIGAVEHLFEAQWMMNHTAKSIKDQLDLASKLIFQTSDGNFVGQNALNSIENGDILVHAISQPLTQVNNGSHDIVSLQNFGQMWKGLSNEIVGISEAMLGQNPPSGSAWKQTEALLNESHSLFELMTENKGLAIEAMLREYVIPHLKKKMNNTKEISSILDQHQITQFDSIYVPNEAIKRVNEAMKESILNGQIAAVDEQIDANKGASQMIRKELSAMGSQRFIKPSEIPTETWAEVMKDLEWEIDIDVTGENSTKIDDMTTLNTVFQTIADPVRSQVLKTPQGKLVFNKILSMSGGVSPLELSSMESSEATEVGGQVSSVNTPPTEQL